MTEKIYTILIIDDHPLITEAYKSAIDYVSKKNESVNFRVITAVDCDSAFEIINNYSKANKNIDIIFLDIRLPPSKDKKILSGEDLGLKINALLPDSKIIVSTTLNENYRVHSIFRNINPDGFLIKNDITPKELISSIETVMTDPPYYSRTVLKLLRKEVSNDLLLDNIDRRILYELSIGAKMKELPEILPLSLAGIEKRKRRLKQIFNVDTMDDRELLQKTKEQGFI